METRSFLARLTAFIILIMAASFVVGYFFLPTTDVGNLGLYNLVVLPSYVGYTLVRIGVGAIIALLYSIVMMRVLGVESFSDFRSKLKMAYNDSHIILVRGFVISAMILASFTPFTDPVAYLVNISFRGGIATLIAIWITVAGAWLIGNVTSLLVLRGWVDEPDNDSFAEMTSTIFVGVMIAAVLVR